MIDIKYKRQANM